MVRNVVPVLLLAAAAAATAQEPPLDEAMTEMGIEFRLPRGRRSYRASTRRT